VTAGGLIANPQWGECKEEEAGKSQPENLRGGRHYKKRKETEAESRKSWLYDD